MYIQSVPEAGAEGKLSELYAADLSDLGYLANYTQVMSLRPEVIAAWRQFIKAIRSNMRLRRYELVTYATALALRCRY
jgi:hypothetical protein